MADEKDPIADELDTIPTRDGEGAAADDQNDRVEDDEDDLDDYDDAEQPDEDSEDDGEGEELDTIEVDGKTYQVPKALKAGFMMNADYTRKTQEAAELRRALDARQAELDQQAQVDDEALKARAQLIGIEDQIGQYEKVDWAALERQDPLGAQTHWRTFQQLKDQRQQAQQTISERETERTQRTQQDFAKRLEETRQHAQTQIKGWSPDVDVKVQQFVQEQGIPREFLTANMSPRLYDILHKAWLGNEALKKQSATRQRPRAQLQETRTVGGKSSPGPRKALSEMSMDEYAAHRNAQERKKAAR